MKPFFSQGPGPAAYIETEPASPAGDAGVARHGALTPYSCRLAIYDAVTAAPRVVEVQSLSPDEFIEETAARVYASAREMGGSLPYTVIREIVENLIHAEFREPVISILDNGDTVRFSDQGPGIEDKGRAVLPGYTSATAEMKQVIRGVGSGLPLVREFLAHEGGTLSLEDNLGSGAVVTLKASSAPHQETTGPRNTPGPSGTSAGNADAIGALLGSVPRLSTRQKRVLSLVMEFGEAGPTLISKELDVGLSTAYRDLAFLEEQGLISSDEAGKREISDLGTAYLDSLFE